MQRYLALPLLLALFLLALGCTDKLVTCSSDADCAAGFYCKQDTVCTQSVPQKCANVSYCEQKPAQEAVCGNNVCEALENVSCPQDCEQEKCIIPAIYAPVCGADGKTYQNKFEANCTKVEIAYEGECRQAGACVFCTLPAPSCFYSTQDVLLGNCFRDSEQRFCSLDSGNPPTCVLKKCNAPEGYCCGANGNIVEATEQLGNANCRGQDGICYSCRCLPPDTLIAGEQDSVPIQDLKIGDLVWSLNGKGEKLLAPIIKANSITVPENHTMVRIKLDDGRELLSSTGHPITNGKTVGELKKGDILDNSIIAEVNIEKYNGNKTFDILPASETGYYWANEILIASTLK